MSKHRGEQTPWMAADEYGRSLAGFGVNLLVRNVRKALPFHTEVLGATVLYCDPDFAALEFGAAQWMLHADHTYDGHPLYGLLAMDRLRGLGAELRLHGRDPDEAERVARALGYEVLQEATDKPHGLREAFLFDSEGYLWVPDVPIGGR